MSRYYIDTSSLLNLVRYYRPFDGDDRLLTFFQNKFQNQINTRNIFILIKKVYAESDRVRGGVIVNDLSFLNSLIKSPAITPTPQQQSQIDNWVNPDQSSKFSPTEYDTKKQEYIKGADCQLILNAINDQDNPILVTEETSSSNDGKLFQKIPLICQSENLSCIKLPELLQRHRNEIQINFGIRT